MLEQTIKTPKNPNQSVKPLSEWKKGNSMLQIVRYKSNTYNISYMKINMMIILCISASASTNGYKFFRKIWFFYAKKYDYNVEIYFFNF